MGIFFPDNEKRKTRLIEISTDTQDFLYNATTRPLAKIFYAIIGGYFFANLT